MSVLLAHRLKRSVGEKPDVCLAVRIRMLVDLFVQSGRYCDVDLSNRANAFLLQDLREELARSKRCLFGRICPTRG